MDIIASFLGDWSASVNTASIAFRLLLSLILAAVIGCERSSKRHSAGLRTFMLVSMAATSVMMIDQSLLPDSVHLPAAAVIVSVASLATRSLFTTSRNQIKGLTTAAALWSVSIMGLCTGAGFYTLSFLTFCGILICLSIFPSIEKFLKDRSNHFEVHLELTESLYLKNFVTTIRKLGLEIDDIEFNPAYLHSGLSVYSVSITINSGLLKQYKTHEEIIEALKSLDYINHIEEIQ